MAVFVRRSALAAPAAPVIGLRSLFRADDVEGALTHEALVSRGQQAAAAEGDSDKTSTPAAASKSDAGTASPSVNSTLVSTAVFAIAAVVAAWLLFGTPKFGPTYKPVAGIGAFALFYIAAQAAERLVEMALPYFDGKAGGKSEKVAKRDTMLAQAIANDSDADAAAGAADAQAAVDQLRANRTALAFGCTAAIGMLLCGYLEADFLTAVGVNFGHPGHVDFWNRLLMMAVTGLIVGGGSKALHDTISNISKSSGGKDTPPETGGTS